FKHNINMSGNLLYPAVVAKAEYFRPIAADEVKYIRPRTKRRIKVTIPSPYIIGCRLWNPEHSKKAYAKREALMADFVPILRQEIEACKKAGADTVQLDEPWLVAMVDANSRKRKHMDDPQYEMDLCVDLMNQCVAGITGIETGTHLCHAHFDRKHGSEGPYDLIMPALAKLKIGTISMEYSTPVAGGMNSLAKFPDGPRLGLGCIDHCERRVETPEEVVARAEEAMQYVDKSRITLHPDCGFAPSVQNPMDLDEAYLKLKSMCQAAEMLRQKHG